MSKLLTITAAAAVLLATTAIAAERPTTKSSAGMKQQTTVKLRSAQQDYRDVSGFTASVNDVRGAEAFAYAPGEARVPPPRANPSPPSISSFPMPWW